MERAGQGATEGSETMKKERLSRRALLVIFCLLLALGIAGTIEQQEQEDQQTVEVRR